jgi:hypothetical protein
VHQLIFNIQPPGSLFDEGRSQLQVFGAEGMVDGVFIIPGSRVPQAGLAV